MTAEIAEMMPSASTAKEEVTTLVTARAEEDQDPETEEAVEEEIDTIADRDPQIEEEEETPTLTTAAEIVMIEEVVEETTEMTLVTDTTEDQDLQEEMIEEIVEIAETTEETLSTAAADPQLIATPERTVTSVQPPDAP